MSSSVLWLRGYNPFDKKPDEDLFKQAWYFTKVGAPIPILWGAYMTFLDSLRKKPMVLLGVFLKFATPPVAIAYGGVAATALIYKTRGENWTSKGTPYFLGFLLTSWGISTMIKKNSFSAFWGRGVPIGLAVAGMQHWRERGYYPEFYENGNHVNREAFTIDIHGGKYQKDIHFSSSTKWEDPGRRPVY